MDLTEFLRARLDEDERNAELAEPGPWEHFSKSGHRGSVRNADGIVVRVRGFHTAGHIARHDPARVLREVEAKRRILRQHNVPAVVLPGSGHREGDLWCVGCGFGSDEEPRVEDVNDCPTLRPLAAVYADHPDYREEWRP